MRGMTSCSSPSACTPSVTRLRRRRKSGHFNHAERPAAPRCGWLVTVHRAPAGPASPSGAVAGFRALAADHAQRQTDPIAALLGALEQTPGDQFRGQAVRVRRGRSAAPVISVNVCTPPSANTIKIAATLLTTTVRDWSNFRPPHTPHLPETRFAVKSGKPRNCSRSPPERPPREVGRPLTRMWRLRSQASTWSRAAEGRGRVVGGSSTVSSSSPVRRGRVAEDRSDWPERRRRVCQSRSRRPKYGDATDTEPIDISSFAKATPSRRTFVGARRRCPWRDERVRCVRVRPRARTSATRSSGPDGTGNSRFRPARTGSHRPSAAPSAATGTADLGQRHTTSATTRFGPPAPGQPHVLRDRE